MCHKNFENRFTNKQLTSKNCKGMLNHDKFVNFIQFGPLVRVIHSVVIRKKKLLKDLAYRVVVAVVVIVISVLFKAVVYDWDVFLSSVTNCKGNFTLSCKGPKVEQNLDFSSVPVVHNMYKAFVRKTNEPRHEKNCFSHMRTTKVQISLCIRAV